MQKMIKTLMAAGLLGGSLVGATASLDSAQAMPVASVASHAADPAVTAVQYYGYGYRRPYRRFYGYRRYRGPAGVYQCGPYQHHTHLSRKACR